MFDRLLGLEYFDSGPTQGGAIYLLDFVPEFASIDTDRLFLTTQVTDEITGLIQPTLVERGLDRGDGMEIYILNLLRSLSGRLALKLLSTPTDVSGVLGLALARLFLEQFGLLDDCILIPIDSHISLFTQSGRDNPLSDEISFKRGDLLLVNYDQENRELHFNVIEVKLRSDLGDINAYLSLRQEIEGQLTNTEVELRKQFDPYNQNPDRIDRQVKTRELIALLSFYLQRSKRYGLISKEVGKLFYEFIQTLDQGYQLSTSGIGLIFDFSSQDIAIDEEHAGLIFYRVGKDYLQRLADAGLRQASMLHETLQPAAAISEALLVAEKRQEIILSSDLLKDPQYEEVRTVFRKTTGSKRNTDQQLQTIYKKLDTSENTLQQEEISLPTEETAPKNIQPQTVVQPDNLSEQKVVFNQQMAPSPLLDSPDVLDNEQSDDGEMTKYDVLIGDTSPSRQVSVFLFL